MNVARKECKSCGLESIPGKFLSMGFEMDRCGICFRECNRGAKCSSYNCDSIVCPECSKLLISRWRFSSCPNDCCAGTIRESVPERKSREERAKIIAKAREEMNSPALLEPAIRETISRGGFEKRLKTIERKAAEKKIRFSKNQKLRCAFPLCEGIFEPSDDDFAKCSVCEMRMCSNCGQIALEKHLCFENNFLDIGGNITDDPELRRLVAKFESFESEGKKREAILKNYRLARGALLFVGLEEPITAKHLNAAIDVLS